MPATIARTPWIDDDGSGTTGTVINNAEKTALYNQIDGALAQLGVWTPVPFNASNFSASGGTWTVGSGDVVTYQYCIIGNVCWLIWQIGASDIGGAPTMLLLTVPGTIAASSAVPYLLNTGSGWVAGYCGCDGGANQVKLYPNIAGTGTWPANTGATYVQGQVCLPLA